MLQELATLQQSSGGACWQFTTKAWRIAHLAAAKGIFEAPERCMWRALRA